MVLSFVSVCEFESRVSTVNPVRMILQSQGHWQRLPPILSVLRLDRHFTVVDHPIRAVLSWEPSVLRQSPGLQRRAYCTRLPDDLLPGDTCNDRCAR